MAWQRNPIRRFIPYAWAATRWTFPLHAVDDTCELLFLFGGRVLHNWERLQINFSFYCLRRKNNFGNFPTASPSSLHVSLRESSETFHSHKLRYVQRCDKINCNLKHILNHPNLFSCFLSRQPQSELIKDRIFSSSSFSPSKLFYLLVRVGRKTEAKRKENRWGHKYLREACRTTIDKEKKKINIQSVLWIRHLLFGYASLNFRFPSKFRKLSSCIKSQYFNDVNIHWSGNVENVSRYI